MNFSFSSSSTFPSSSSSFSSSSSSLDTLSPKDKWQALNVELSELCSASDTDSAIDHLLKEGSLLLQAIHSSDIDDTFLQNDEDFNAIQNYFNIKESKRKFESQLNFYAFLDKALFQPLLTNVSKIEKDTVLLKALENIVAIKETIVKVKVKKGKNVSMSPPQLLSPCDLLQSKQFHLYMDHISNNNIFRNKLILMKYLLTLVEDEINELILPEKSITNTPINMNIECAKRLAKINVLSKRDIESIVRSEKENARLKSFQSKPRIVLISGKPSKLRDLEIQGRGLGFIGGTKINVNSGKVYFEVTVKGEISTDIRIGWTRIDLDPKSLSLPGDCCNSWAFDAVTSRFFHDTMSQKIKDNSNEVNEISNNGKVKLTESSIEEDIAPCDPRLQIFVDMVRGGLDVNAIQWMMRREGLEDEEIDKFLATVNAPTTKKDIANSGIPLKNSCDDEDHILNQDSVLGFSLCTESGEATLYIDGIRIDVAESHKKIFALAKDNLKSALESCGVRPILSCISGVGLEINLGQAPFKFPLDQHIGILEQESEDSPLTVSPYLHFPIQNEFDDTLKLKINKEQIVNNNLNGFTVEVSIRLHDLEGVNDINSDICTLNPSIYFEILDKSASNVSKCNLVFAGDGTIIFEIDDIILCKTSADTIDKNVWRHIALSYSVSKGSEALCIYIDGHQVHKADLKDSSKISPLITSIQAISIESKKMGNNYMILPTGNVTAGHPWDICELRVWSIARTEENIKSTLGRLKISGIENNLIFCMSLVEGGGNYVYNSSYLQDTGASAIPEHIKLDNQAGITWEQDVLYNVPVTNYDSLKEPDSIGLISKVLIDNLSAHYQLPLWFSLNIANQMPIVPLENEVVYKGLGELFSQIILSMSLNIENYCDGLTMNSRIKQLHQFRNVHSIVDPHVLNFVLMNSILRQVLRSLNASLSDGISSMLLGISIVVLKLLEINLKTIVDDCLSPASSGLQYSTQLENCNKSFVAKLLVSICNFISLPILSRKRNERSSMNQMIEVIRKVAVDVVITGFDIFLPHTADRLILLQCLLFRKRLNNPSFVQEINLPAEVQSLLEKSSPNTFGPDIHVDPLRALLSLSYDGETLLLESLFKMFKNVSNASKLISPLMQPMRINGSLDEYVKISSNVNSLGEYVYPQLGELVERGPDWKYDDQDGSSKEKLSIGIIINIEQWCDDNKGTCLTVLWISNGSINSYRWGVSDPLVSTLLLYDLKIYRKTTSKDLDVPKDLYERKALKYTPDEVLQSLVSQVGELSKRTVLNYILDNSTPEWQEKYNITRSINTLVSKLSAEEISKLYSSFYTTFGFKKSNNAPFLSMYSSSKNDICMCEQLKLFMILLTRDISLSVQESNFSSKDESSNQAKIGIDLLIVLQGILTGVNSNQNIRPYTIESAKDKIIRKPFTSSENKLMQWDWKDGTWSNFNSEIVVKTSVQDQSKSNNVVVDPDIKILDDLAFDSSFISDNLIINDDCKTAEQSGHNQWSTAVGSIAMHPNTGVYRWYSRVDSFGGKKGNCIFGIASEDCCCESFLGSSEDGWGLTTNQELFHEGDKVKCDFGSKITLGIIVEITLDTNTGTLTYSMPQLSNQVEIAFTCLDEITYYPAWSFYATGDSISILSGIEDKIEFSNYKLRELRSNLVEIPCLSGVPTKWIIDYCLELIRTTSTLIDEDTINVEHDIISGCFVQLMSTLSRWQCINPYEIKNLINGLNELIQKISYALIKIPFSVFNVESDEITNSENLKRRREYLNQLSCIISSYLGMLTNFLINGGGKAQINNLLIAKVVLEEVYDPNAPSTSNDHSAKRDWLKTKIFSQGFRSIKDSKTELVAEFLHSQSPRFSLLFDWLDIHDVTHINFKRLGGATLNNVVRLLFGAIVYHSGYLRALSSLASNLLKEVQGGNKNILDTMKPPQILIKAWEYAMKFRLDTKEEVVREGTSYEVVARRSIAKLKLLLDLEQYRNEIDCPGNNLAQSLENWQPRYQNHIYQILTDNSTFCRSFASDKSSVSFLRANLIEAETRASMRKDGLKSLRMCIGNLTDEFGWGLKCALVRLYPVALKLNTSCIFHNPSSWVLMKTTIPKVGHYLSGLDGCSKSEKLELKGAFDSLFSCFTEELIRSFTGSDTSLQLNIIACLGTQILEDDHVMLSRVGIFNVLQDLLDSALSSSQHSIGDDDKHEASGSFKKVVKATMKLFILLALQVASSGESEAYHTLSISRENSIREKSTSRELKTSRSGPATLSSAVFRILYTLLTTVMKMITTNLKKSDVVGTNVMVSIISHDAYVIIDETTILLSFISKEQSCQKLLKNPQWLQLLLDLTILSPACCQPRAMMILSYLLPSMEPQDIERSSPDLLSVIEKYTPNLLSSKSASEKIVRIILNQCSRLLMESEIEVLVTTVDHFTKTDTICVIVPVASEAVGLIRSFLQSSWSHLTETILSSILDSMKMETINSSNVSEIIAALCVIGGHIDYVYPQSGAIIDNGAGSVDFGIVCNAKSDVVEVVKEIKNDSNYETINSYEKIAVPFDKVRPVNRVSIGDLHLSDSILKKLVDAVHILLSNKFRIDGDLKSNKTDSSSTNDENELDSVITDGNVKGKDTADERIYDSKIELIKSCAIRSMSSLVESRVLSQKMFKIIKLHLVSGSNVLPEFINNLISLANADSKANGISDIPIYEEYLVTLNTQRQKLLINHILKVLSPVDLSETSNQIEKSPKTNKNDSYLRIHDDKELPGGESKSRNSVEANTTHFPSQRSEEKDEHIVDSATVDLLENMGFPRRWCEIALQLCGDDFGEAVNYILSNGDTIEQIANDQSGEALRNYLDENDEEDMEPDDCDDQDSENFLMRLHQSLKSQFGANDNQSDQEINNTKDHHYIETAQRFLPLYAEPDEFSERLGCIFPGDDVSAYAEVTNKKDGSTWLKVKLADHEDDCQFSADEENDKFNETFVYIPQYVGGVKVMLEGNSVSMQEESRRRNYPSEAIAVKAVYKIVGLNGAMVREGIETESKEVLLLGRSEIVHVCEEGYNSEGKLRLRITQPVAGWISKLVGLVTKMFEENINPESRLQDETKASVPSLSDMELLEQLEDDMEQWIGGDIFCKEDRFFGTLQGMHYNRCTDATKSKYNSISERRSRIMGSSHRSNVLNDLTFPSVHLEDLISSKLKTFSILHTRKLAMTLFLSVLTTSDTTDPGSLISILESIVTLKTSVGGIEDREGTKLVCFDLLKFLRLTLFRGDPYTYINDLSMSISGNATVENMFFYFIEGLLQHSNTSMEQELTAGIIASIAQNVRIACSSSFSETSWYDSMYQDESDSECLNYGNIHFALWASRILIRRQSYDVTFSVFSIWNLSMRASSMSLKQIAFTMCSEILNAIIASHNNTNLLEACLKIMSIDRLEFMCAKRLWYEMEDDPFYSRFLQALIDLLAMIKSAQDYLTANHKSSLTIEDNVVQKDSDDNESTRSIIRFEATRSHMILSPQSDVQGSWTVEFWIYCHGDSPDSAESNSNIIASSYLMFSSNGFIKLRAGGRLFKDNEIDDPEFEEAPVHENALCMSCGTTRNSTEKSFDYIVPSNQWVHLALSCKGSSSNNTVNLFVNGELKDAVNLKFSLPISHIGSPRGGQSFSGDLAEMRVWSHARSAAEITRDMNVDVSGAKGLLLQLKCLEGRGTRIYDSAGYLNVSKLVACSWTEKRGPKLMHNTNPAFMLTSPEEFEGIYGELVGDSAGVIEMTGTITRIGITGVPQGETTDNATEVICLCYRMREIAGDYPKKSGEIEGYLDWCDRNVRSRISGLLSESGHLEFRIIENSTILGSPESMNWLHNLKFSGHFNDGELAGSLSIQYNVQTPCLKPGESRLDLFSIPKEVAYKKKSDSKERVTETLSVRDGRPEGQYIITVEAFPRKSKLSERSKEESNESNSLKSLTTYGLCSGQGSAWVQWYIEKSNGSISFGVLSEDAMSTSDSCVFANPDVWCYNVQGSASHSTDICETAMANVGDTISVRIDTDQGIIEFYRNDNFIHHFSNLNEHPAFVNVEESNSNGLRLFVCLSSEGDVVKYLGPKDGAVTVKYCEENYLNRDYVKGTISDGDFNGTLEIRNQGDDGYYYGDCITGKQNGIQLFIVIDNSIESVKTAYLFEHGTCLRELSELERDESNNDTSSPEHSIRSDYKKLKAAFLAHRGSSQPHESDEASDLGQFKRVLRASSRSPRIDAQPSSVTFRLRDRTGSELHFKVSIQVKIQKVFDVYASKKNVDVKSLKFTLDGENITGEYTPEMLDIQENDTIEVSCSGDPVVIETLLKKSTAPYILQIILSNGATVRNGIEIEDSASVRMLQCGEVVEAYNKAKTKEGIIRFRIADGWISEKLRGGNEDQVISVLRILPSKPFKYKVVREGGAKVRVSEKLQSDDIGFIPLDTTIEIAEKRFENSEGEATMRLRVVAPAEWAGWISDKSHIVKALDEEQEEESIDPEILNELSRRSSVRQRKALLFKEKSNSIHRLVNIQGSLRLSSKTFFLIGDSQKKPGLTISSDFSSVICETSIHGRLMAIGSRGFSRGIHYWEVGVDSAQWGSVFIGVAPYEATNSWGGYGLLNYRATQAFGNETLYGSYFGAGDTVGVLLDMDHGTLSFFKDGQFCSENIVINMGVAYHNLRRNNKVSSTELFPCFGMKATNDKLTIRNSHWISNRGLGHKTKLSQILQAKRFLFNWKQSYQLSTRLSQNMYDSYLRQCSDNKTVIKSRPGIEVVIDTKDSVLIPEFDLVITSATKITKSRYGKGKVLGMRRYLESIQIWFRIDSDSCGAWYWTKEDIVSMIEKGDVELETDIISKNTTTTIVNESKEHLLTLEDFVAFMINPAWTKDEDEKIVAIVNKLANKLNIDPLRITSTQIEDCRITDNALPNRTVSQLQARYAAICVLNKAASIALPFLDFGISSNHIPLIRTNLDSYHIKESQFYIDSHFASSGQLFVDIKGIIFTRTKLGLWNLAVKESTINTAPHPDEFERPEDLRELVVNRIEARHASQNKDLIPSQKCLSLSVFGQLMNGMRNWDDKSFRRGFVHKEDDGQARAFFVKFVGEGVDDHGGPYRAVFQTAIGEESSNLIGLITPSANSKAELGEHRDKFVFDPTMTANPEGLPLYTYLGKLLGVACRHSIQVNLSLPKLIWKPLVGEALDLSDLDAVDRGVVQSLDSILLSNVPEESIVDLLTQALLNDLPPTSIYPPELKILLSEINDCPKNSISTEKIAKICTVIKDRRLVSHLLSLQYFYRGLSVSLPTELFSIFTSSELENLFCGAIDIDINVLKKATVYDGVNPSDRHIQMFWSVIEKMSQDELSKLINFCSGRSRLPDAAADFTMKFKLIAPPPSSQQKPDEYLPIAQTCFFSLSIPEYTTEEIATSKLKYAISNTELMDADFVMHNAHGWENVNTDNQH